MHKQLDYLRMLHDPELASLFAPVPLVRPIPFQGELLKQDWDHGAMEMTRQKDGFWVFEK